MQAEAYRRLNTIFGKKKVSMDLQIKDKCFMVGGAGSGFGRAIAAALAQEGGRVLAVSRTESKLIALQSEFPGLIEILPGDITEGPVHDLILEWFEGKEAGGAVINAGGPPAGGFFDTELALWDNAWSSVVRWKIALTQRLIPLFRDQRYGRLLFIESVSVKQPVQHLILSNALRPAIVGFAKTLSQEAARLGITVNVLAPGYHTTPALERLFRKKSEMEKITVDEARTSFEKEIPVGKMATAEEMAPLALYLLSPLSRYITGQTITHDGGTVSGIFG